MKLKRLFFFLLIITITFLSGFAHDWQGAQWIWQAEDGPSNSWMAFRRTISLDEIPDEVLARISVDSKYWLWVNGALVVFEGGVARGPSQAGDWEREKGITPSNSWYESVDIGPWLKPGENTIALLVWYWGRETHKGTHIDSKKGGLLFHCQLGKQTVVSDASWKVKKHPAYNFTSGDEGDRLVQYRVDYDARRDMDDWSDQAWYSGNFSDENWEPAIEKGKAGSAPWYELIENYVPSLVNHGLKDFENTESLRLPFVSDGNPIVCELPFNMQVTPYFEVEAGEGDSIYVTTDNRLNKITSTYTAKAGAQAYECFAWMSGHSIRYEIPAGVKVKALKYRWMSVGQMAGCFESSDPFYNRLWEMGRNTLFVCARDNFMDCPDRERALWIGDVADQTGYLFYTMDHAGRQLLKKAISITMNFSEDKVIGALGPLRVRELPGQSLQFIAQTVWPYYLNTGDRETLEEAYPYVYDYLALFGMQANGLPVYRRRASPDSWDWNDWGQKGTIDSEVIQTSLYYMALTQARKMAEVLGETSHIAWYSERMVSMEASFHEAYWKEGFYSSDADQFQDDRANALAILSGLADSSTYAQVVNNVLVSNYYCSPHFEWMVNEAMCVAGFHEEALARMKERYRSQVENTQLTTLYEKFPQGGSYNHAWNAPNTVLSKYIAGIAPTAPAWSEYQVKPMLAHLTSVKETIPSVKGDIELNISREDELFQIDLSSPAGTRAIVGIPGLSKELSRIEVNGIVIWKNGEAKSQVEGVSLIGFDSNFFKLGVLPGTWLISAYN